MAVLLYILRHFVVLPPPTVGQLPDGLSEPVEPIVIADGDSDDVILPNGIATEVSRTLNDVSLVGFTIYFNFQP